MKYLFLITVIVLFILGIIFLTTNPKKNPTEPGTGVDADITIYGDPVDEPQFDNAELKKKLDSIMIEHMEFEDAPIPAVIKALRYEARTMDPEKKGVNIVLLQNQNRGVKVEVDLDDGDEEEDFLLDDLETLPEDEPEPVEGVAVMGERTITIMFDDLSLGEAIRNICIAAEMKYRIEEYAVVIAGKDVAFDNLETRIYPVDSEADFGQGGGESLASVQKYFERQGIDFPNGATIVYDDAISRIIATNTPDQLRRIERIIEELNVVDPQVLVTARFVKIPDREFRKLKGTKSLSVWDQVILSDKTEILASATMVTQNGEEGTVRMVREVYFPDSWGECGYTSTTETESESEKDESESDEEKEKEGEDDDLGLELGSEKEKPAPNGQVISYSSMPEFGEPTELGMRLTTTPTVDPDKYTITLDMIPVIQHFSGWTDYENDIKMPIIKAWTVTTQVTLYDGDTFPLGFSFEDVENKSKRERNRFMALVTATLVNPDGTPLRNKDGNLNPIPKKKRRPPVNAKSKKPELNKPKALVNDFHFEDADIENIIDFLNMEIKKKENFNIVLALDEYELERVPDINLDLRDIPYDELIRYICMVTGLQYRLDGNTITIGKYVGDMETSFFKVRSALIARVAPASDYYDDDDVFQGTEEIDESGQALKSFVSMEGVYLPKGSNVSYDPKTGRYTVDSRNTRFEDYESPRRNSVTSLAMRQYFIDRGVPFPPGSYITYSRRSGKLIVHNTQENLRRLGTLLRCLCIEQPQVLLETTILEISNKDLIEVIGKNAALSDNLSEAQINKIIDSGKGRILASPTVLAKNGEEANVRLVNEIYYPDTWSCPEIAPLEGYLSEISAVPEFSESTDYGSSLTYTPTVSPDNFTIYLALSPQFIDFHGWTEYPNYYKIESEGKVRTGRTNVKMPVRGRRDLNLCVKIYDGDTILAARTQQIDISDKKYSSFDYPKNWTEMLRDAKRQGEELKNVFYFIKANIINPDGEFVRE